MELKNWNANYDKALEELKPQFPEMYELIKDLILTIRDLDARLQALEP